MKRPLLAAATLLSTALLLRRCRRAGADEDAALRAARRPEDPRPVVHDRVHHAQLRLHGLRHAVRAGREGHAEAADGRQVHDLEGRQAVVVHVAARPEVPRRQRGHRSRLRRLAAALGRARLDRPGDGRGRRRVEGGRREQLHADVEGAVRPRARRAREAVGLSAGDHAGAPREDAGDRAADRGDGLGPVPLQARRMGAGQQGGVRAQPELRRPRRAAERPVGQQEAALRPRRVALPARLEQLDRGAEERRGRPDRAGPARLHHAAARRPEHQARQRRLVPGLHRDEPASSAVQQPEGAPGRAARRQPGEVRRRHGLPARHAADVLLDLVHLRRAEPDRCRRRAVPQARPREGEAAARRRRLQGREDRRAAADRHHAT